MLNQERMKTAVSIITGFFAILVSLGTSFFLSPFITANMGEEANGFTQLANNFVTYASLITVAFNSMASRFISVAHHQNNKDKALSYYASVIVCNITVGILLLPVSIILTCNIDAFINIGTSDLEDIKILFGCVFANFFVGLGLSIFQIATYVKNALYIQNLIAAMRNVLNAVILLLVFRVFPPRMYYVTCVALVLSILILPLYIYQQKKLLPYLNFHIKMFRWKSVREMLSGGIWNTVNQCGNILMTGLDLLIANLFISPAVMGVLAISKTVPSAIINVATSLNSNLSPSVTQLWALGDKKSMLRELRYYMKLSGMVVSIPIMTFSCFGREFYSLWMPTLDAGMLSVLSVLALLAYIPWAGPQTLYNVFTATNKLKVNSVAFCVNGILNIMIVYFCLKYTGLGVYAVAGVSAVTTIVRNLIITEPYVAKLLNVKWYEFYKDVGISLLYATVNFIVGMSVRLIISVNGWASLVVAVMITVMITAFLEFFIAFNKTERMKIMNKTKERIRRHGQN